MGAQAEALAQQVQTTCDEVAAALDGLSEQQWRATCAPEGWSVGVTAHHIGASYAPVSGILMAIANGQQVPGITPEMLDAGNAQHAQQFANVGKQETVDLVRAEGAKAAGMVRGLGDEQLQRSAPLFPGTNFTAAQVVENILIGHPRQHLESIRGALA